MYNNPKLKLTNATSISSGQVAWRCPSNIALVKYWGKYGIQYPRNTSISYTLSAAHTDTFMSYKTLATDSQNGKINLAFTFEGKPQGAFAAKLEKFLNSLLPIFPFLSQLELVVESANSFPHSSGIASSASSMAAIACCLCSMEQQLFNTLSDETEFWRKASYIARLGSGSACRSVYGTAAIWGEHPEFAASSNDFAIQQTEFHPLFQNYKDAVLIVDRAEKSVSSRAGHALMETNPYAATRYEQANTHLAALVKAMQTGDMTTFIRIVEAEAMVLHALMMCSEPSYILMRPNTLSVIEKIRTYRQETKVPVCFTLDAGPNVHVLYPEKHAAEVEAFILNELEPLCVDGYWIADQVGKGPIALSEVTIA